MKLHAILLAVALSACYVSAPPPDPGYPSPPVDTQPQPIEPAMPAPSPDYGNVPRVMFWPGKVAQHWDTNTQRWETDPDGVTGAARDDAERLAHCRKWYPWSAHAAPFAQETITTWRERGNYGAHTATMQSYECLAAPTPYVPPAPPTPPTPPAPPMPQYSQPRVMFWPGKVAQHFDVRAMRWETDPDGVTGAARDDAERLAHCRKWYPATAVVRVFTTETISTWRERGNVGAHTAARTSYECVPGAPVIAVPRVMFWPGKVSQHFDVRTMTWATDPDGVTGAARDDAERLAHCRKWYPATRFVRPYAMETISTWRERGNVNAHTATMQSYECVAR